MVPSLCVDPHRTTGEVLRAVMVTTDCQPKGLSGLSQERHLLDTPERGFRHWVNQAAKTILTGWHRSMGQGERQMGSSILLPRLLTVDTT